MKRLYFGFIWQWKWDTVVGFNPIGLEFEYEKFDPSLTIKLVIMGIGFQVVWLVPWDTKESVYAKECSDNILSILGMEDRSNDNPTT